MLALIATAGFIGFTYAAVALALAAIRTGKALDNALDQVAHGDCFPVSDASLVEQLKAVRGGCSEVGFPIHAERNTL